MHKFIFLALVSCAVFPEWPIQAVAAGHHLIDGFQSRVMLISQVM